MIHLHMVQKFAVLVEVELALMFSEAPPFGKFHSALNNQRLIVSYVAMRIRLVAYRPPYDVLNVRLIENCELTVIIIDDVLSERIIAYLTLFVYEQALFDKATHPR